MEPGDRESAIVAALRRIMRGVEMHSRRLFEEHGLTAPQLATLRVIGAGGPITPAAIADRVHLSRGTVTGILARLEQHGLVARRPAAADRRSVVLELTAEGRERLRRAPSLLQERFRQELSLLAEWEQTLLLSTLQRIATMMGVAELDASPHLVSSTEEISGRAVPDADGAPRPTTLRRKDRRTPAAPREPSAPPERTHQEDRR